MQGNWIFMSTTLLSIYNKYLLSLLFLFCPLYSLPFLVYVELYYLYISLFFMRYCCSFNLLFFDII